MASVQGGWEALRRTGKDLGRISRLIAVWAMTYGAIIIVQGDPSWSARAYDIMHRFPGAPETVGFFLVFCGFWLFVFERIRPRLAGIFAFGVGIATLYIGVGFALADLTVDGAAPTGQPGAVTYLIFLTPVIFTRAVRLVRDRV